MPGVIASIPKFQFSDANGAPMVGGTLSIYVAGTTTPTTTWQDAALSIANTNPVTLDSRGECVLWLDSAIVYKFVLKNAAGVIQWTQDNLSNSAALANALRAELAASNGAAIIGGAAQTVASITALRSLLKTSASKAALVSGYYAAGDGGGGRYTLDASDTTTADNGGTVIVAADGGRWKLAYTDGVTVKQFGAKADDATDNLAAFAAARAWQASFVNPPEIIFTEGIYRYSVSPNWGQSNAKVSAVGTVRLRYTGTGSAVILDGGASPAPGYFYGAFTGFIVEAPGTAGNAIYCRNWHHGKLQAKVRGAGTTSSGLLSEYCVCTVFDVAVTYAEEGGWYGAGTPKYGITLAARLVTEQTSYCTFTNPICEHVSETGIYLNGSLGNMFFGGTSEANAYGVRATTLALQDKFYGTDFEQNTAQDVLTAGISGEWHGISCSNKFEIQSGAQRNKVLGGIFQQLNINGGALYNLVSGVTYNRFADGSSLIDAGTGTRLRDNYESASARYENAAPAATVLTVPASPATFAVTGANAQAILVSGGTVSNITFSRLGSPIGTGQTQGLFDLSPGDTLIVTYSAAPAVLRYTR